MSDQLTIGMATRGEFDSLYFTLTALAANHPRVSYLVVDNTPERCERSAAITQAVGGRYLHRPDLSGTSKPRDAAFQYARTPWVMCVDSHIVFESYPEPSGGRQSSIARLLDWLDNNPNCTDLLQGPLVTDDGEGCYTHWNKVARNALWGEWEQAYVSDHGGNPFTFRVRADQIELCSVMTGAVFARLPITENPAQKYGWHKANPHTAPFEIPQMGLGCWLMRKDRWPGFNPLFQGFGGEEGYIHEKVRQQGGRTLCLPFLRWRHKFRDGTQPTPYPVRLDDHTANLLYGHRELGIADAEGPIFDHFGKRITLESWMRLVKASRDLQPLGGPRRTVPRKKLLAVWYTDNTAPPELMSKSLRTISDALEQTTRHDVTAVVVGWERPAGCPFQFVQYDGERKRSHAALVRQIAQAMEHVGTADAVICLEHDVLYPANYFDRMGDAFGLFPNAQVVSHTDYIGLNATGWLGVKERHEPMHQLGIRWDKMRANLERAAADCARQGWTNVEPDHDSDRSTWLRLTGVGMPAVHVNHTKDRFTAHGEVCYHQDSGGVVTHGYWGKAAHYWPGGKLEPAKTNGTPAAASCSSCGNAPPMPATLAEWYELARTADSDFVEHVVTLKELCDGMEHVAELSGWSKPALVAMLASSAKKVTSYVPGQKREWPALRKLEPERLVTSSVLPAEIEPCDLLFCDTNHTADTVYDQLTRHEKNVRRYLVIHTTEIFGERGDDGGPGVLHAIRRFLKENRRWTSVRNDPNNNGMVVLSCDDRDKKQPPGVLRKALNFAKALAAHAADGRTVPLPVYEARLELCAMCPERFHDGCGACGCPIDKKAAWASEQCGKAKYNDPARPILWDVYTDEQNNGLTPGAK